MDAVHTSCLVIICAIMVALNIDVAAVVPDRESNADLPAARRTCYPIHHAHQQRCFCSCCKCSTVAGTSDRHVTWVKAAPLEVQVLCSKEFVIDEESMLMVTEQVVAEV